MFRSFLALSLVRWTWGHAGDAGKVSSKAGMGKIMSNRPASSITLGGDHARDPNATGAGAMLGRHAARALIT